MSPRPSLFSLVGFKGTFMGLILVVAYSAMVIDIIGFEKVRTGEGERSAAVIAALTGAILQTVWCTYYFVARARGVAFKASNVLAAYGLFFVWQIVTMAITIVFNQRDEPGYCSITNTIKQDCDGAFEGVVGIGFSLAGLNLLYIGYLAALVSSTRSAWSDDIQSIPREEFEEAKF